MLLLNEILFINIVYFYFSKSKLVKQSFVDLLSRMTNIQFLPNLIHMNLTFFYKNIPKKVCIGQFVVNEMYYFFLFACISCIVTLWENYTTTVGTLSNWSSSHDPKKRKPAVYKCNHPLVILTTMTMNFSEAKFLYCLEKESSCLSKASCNLFPPISIGEKLY